MAHKKKRSKVNEELESDSPSKRGSPRRAEEPDPLFPAGRREEASFRDDDDFDDELPSIADTHSPHEPDPREVDMLTDRIFGAVLSRFGWERHEGRFEHIGEKDRQRR
jgi:hypothetical protein